MAVNFLRESLVDPSKDNKEGSLSTLFDRSGLNRVRELSYIVYKEKLRGPVPRALRVWGAFFFSHLIFFSPNLNSSPMLSKPVAFLLEFYAIIFSTILAIMIEIKLFRWFIVLYNYLVFELELEIHQDFVFLLVLIFVFVSWILVRYGISTILKQNFWYLRLRKLGPFLRVFFVCIRFSISQGSCK
nr:hypothetical protein [Solanum melongena]